MSTPSSLTQTATPRKPSRWLRFSLRLLLIAVTVLCIGLGWWTQRARQQQRIVRHIEDQLGSVSYDYEPLPSPNMTPAQSRVPRWLIEALGVDLFHTVVRAHVRGDVDFKEVAQLTNLEGLMIWNEDLSDDQFEHVAKLRRLRDLTVQSGKHGSLPGDYPDTTRIGDKALALIAKLPDLDTVYIEGTGITRTGLADLSKSESLRIVVIRGCDTSVTADDIEEFRRTGRVIRLQVHKWTPEVGVEIVANW